MCGKHKGTGNARSSTERMAKFSRCPSLSSPFLSSPPTTRIYSLSLSLFLHLTIRVGLCYTLQQHVFPPELFADDSLEASALPFRFLARRGTKGNREDRREEEPKTTRTRALSFPRGGSERARSRPVARASMAMFLRHPTGTRQHERAVEGAKRDPLNRILRRRVRRIRSSWRNVLLLARVRSRNRTIRRRSRDATARRRFRAYSSRGGVQGAVAWANDRHGPPRRSRGLDGNNARLPDGTTKQSRVQARWIRSWLWAPLARPATATYRAGSRRVMEWTVYDGGTSHASVRRDTGFTVVILVIKTVRKVAVCCNASPSLLLMYFPPQCVIKCTAESTGNADIVVQT